jgi:hypothetical protein
MHHVNIMKIVTVCCCCALLFASACFQFASAQGDQPPPASPPKDTVGQFPGIPWGTPPANLKAAVLKIKGVAFMSDSAGGLWFRGGTYLDHPVETWSFDFWKKDYFWFARVQFKMDSTSTPPLEDDVVQKLTGLYGAPPEHENWRFTVGGEAVTNVVSIFPDMGKGLQLWYSAGGYVDSLEKRLK